MKTSGRAAFCWLLLLCLAAAATAAPRRLYCERADVAWRAYRAPAAFEARVQSIAKDAATVKVRRVLRRQGHWPHEDAVIRLKLPTQDPLECSGRFEVPLVNRRNYIVFAERRGHAAVALGPPLQRTSKLLRRIRAVYKPGYSPELVPPSPVNEITFVEELELTEPSNEQEQPTQLDTNDVEPLAPSAEVPGTEETTDTNTLDPNIMVAFGEVTDDRPEFGDKIHDCLAKIWTPLLKKGLTKDAREKLLKEYLIPENCILLKSPTLNPEILVAIPETGRYRDKKMSTSQEQLGIGITAINRGLNLLLTDANSKVEAIKFISDGCRILSDLHFQNTESRIRFITPGLDKTFLQLIKVSERDDTLFGNKLSDKIKASKAITKQSQQIKKTSVPKASTSQAPTTRANNNNQGNWQGPPRYQANRGGRGIQRRTSQRVPTQSSTAQSKTNQAKTRKTTRQ